MKFLECAHLESLSSNIAQKAIDCKLDIRIETYSCKMVQSDKKQWKKEYESFSSTRQALSPPEDELVLSPVGRRLRHISASETSDNEGGILVDSIDARTLFDLIAVLNASYSDYDFNDRKSDSFCLVPTFDGMQQKVDEKLSTVVFDYSRLKNDLWSTLKNEIKPEECIIYGYKSDYISDPFTDDGCVWAFNFFLHNKILKRFLFLSCRALSTDVAGDMSSDQVWDREE